MDVDGHRDLQLLLRRLWVSDIAGPTDDEHAIGSLRDNCRCLKEYGANVATDPTDPEFEWPILHVTGFPKTPDGPAPRGIARDELATPKEILPPGDRLGCVIWGAPHGSSGVEGLNHAPRSINNSDFKTKAFQAIAWMTHDLDAVAVMTFPSGYKIEFWPPGVDNFPDNRNLVVCEVEYHGHRSSVTGHRAVISSNPKEMIAMLVPDRFLPIVVCNKSLGKLQFGAFMWDLYRWLDADQHIVEIGCNMASLSMEFVLEYQSVNLGWRRPGTFDVIEASSSEAAEPEEDEPHMVSLVPGFSGSDQLAELPEEPEPDNMAI